MLTYYNAFILKRVITFLLLFILLHSLLNQAHAGFFKNNVNTNIILVDTVTDELSITRYSYYYADSTNNLSVNEVEHAAWEDFDKIPTFQPDNITHWFKIVFKNPLDKEATKVLYIPYSSIYIIDVYQENKDTINKIVETGIKRNITNKEARTTGYPATLNFKAGSTSIVYVKFKHVYRPLRTTMYLFSKKRFSEILYRSLNLLWLWRGIYLFAIVVSLIAYFFLKQKSFLFYSMLNAGVSFYIFSHVGEIPLILGSDPTDFSSSVDYIGAFLINLSLPLFLNSLSPLKENNKTLWKIMLTLIYGIIPFVLISFIPSIRLNFVTLIIHNYIMIVSGIVLILQVYFLTKNTLNKKENALILLIIYTIYIVFSFVDIILPNMGFLEDKDYIYKQFFIGSFIEVFSFMFLMSKQTLRVYRERSVLVEKQKNHQKEILFSIVKSQESARIRAGQELHDLIGTNMAIIKQKIADTSPELRKIITQTIEAIRDMSHGLVISNIIDNAFKDEIRDLCYSASSDKIKFHVYFHQWPEIDNTEITTHIYRITQELVQNALKHSQASNVYLQYLSNEKNEIILMYEDNGIGFNVDTRENKNGVGLKNIKSRVEILNGNIEIDSKLNGAGTNVMIEIDYSNVNEIEGFSI